MATGVTSWSTTAASNSTADSTVNWAEGQAPSTVNDSARAMMASVAKYRDDNAGTLTTGGTSTAYTLTSNQSFASLSALSGVKLKVRFNATNGASPTLNVDSLGAKAIQTASGTAVGTGAILANSIHDVTYDNSIPAFLLSGALSAATGAIPGNLLMTSGSVINWNSGDVTQTHAANTLTWAGATSGYQFQDGPIRPVSNDGLALGASGVGFSDLFLASGGVINWSGNVTLTHSAGQLAIVGALTISTTLGVTGAATLSSTLAVTGAATLTGALTANNSAGITARNTIKAAGKVIDGTLQAGSFNVASITDNGTSHTVTFTSAMANANYVIILTLDGDNSPTPSATLRYHTVAAGSFRVEAAQATVSNNLDPDSYSFMVLSNE